MQISNRLRAVASMVTQGNRVADIGCDHAFVPIYLIREGRIPSAIAMDVNSGPLLRARDHIDSYGLSEYIETRLSNGLSALGAGEADTVIIAGMGGPLMQEILCDGKEILREIPEMILQPQSDLEGFRRFLARNGYGITQEHMILEDGKYYQMMRAVHGEVYELDEMQYRFGPMLLAEKNPILARVLERESILKRKILSRLEEEGIRTDESERRREELLNELFVIKEAQNALREYN